MSEKLTQNYEPLRNKRRVIFEAIRERNCKKGTFHFAKTEKTRIFVLSKKKENGDPVAQW